MKKLRDLGWGEELDAMAPYYTPLRRFPIIRQPKLLTENGQQRPFISNGVSDIFPQAGRQLKTKLSLLWNK